MCWKISWQGEALISSEGLSHPSTEGPVLPESVMVSWTWCTDVVAF